MGSTTLLHPAIFSPVLSCLFLVHVRAAAAALVNRTIDDQEGDSVTGAIPTYFPQAWNTGQTCDTCSLHPGIIDPQKAFDGTWTDTTYEGADRSSPDRIVQVSFTGSAVYVFNIVVEGMTLGGPIATVNLTFYIDDELVGTYYHQPYIISSDTPPPVAYHVLVYGNTSVPDGQHTLRMMTSDSDAANILFDYIVYSTEDDAEAPPGPSSLTGSLPSSSPNAAPLPSPSSHIGSLPYPFRATLALSGEPSNLSRSSTDPSVPTSTPTSSGPAPTTSLPGLAGAASPILPSGSPNSMSIPKLPPTSSNLPSTSHAVVATSTSTISLRKSSSSTTAIVGGAAGGAGAILLVFIFCFFIRRSSPLRRRAVPSQLEDESESLFENKASSTAGSAAVALPVPGVAKLPSEVLKPAPRRTKSDSSRSVSQPSILVRGPPTDPTDPATVTDEQNARVAQLMQQVQSLQTQFDELRAARDMAGGNAGVISEPSTAERNVSAELSALRNEMSALRVEVGEQLFMALEVPPSYGG